MKVIKPKKLVRGDTIGIITPASHVADATRIEKSVKYFESLGYNVEVSKTVTKGNGYLAGTDDERIDELHKFFSNKKINAIFCARGGYGAARLLNSIDYNIIKKNPKIFVGYSDITAIQLAFFVKTKLVTFAGPMPAVDFYDEINPYAEEYFWRILTSTKSPQKFTNPNNEHFYSLTSGIADGTLLGGNLCVLTSLAGTAFFPEFKNSILLLEEIGEAPYRIDRMINQLKMMSVLKKIKGVVLGRFLDCIETDTSKSTFSINEVIAHYFGTAKIPILYNVRHGHVKENLTLPIGLNVHINSTKKTMEIKEAAVI